MSVSPVRARPVSKRSLRAKILKEGVNDLHDVFDKMMQRHTLELHMLLEKWVSQGDAVRPQSPTSSAWGSRSCSPNVSRAPSAHGRRWLQDETGKEPKAQHVGVAGFLEQDSRPGTADKLHSRREVDASRPASANTPSVRSNIEAKDVEGISVPNLPGCVHHPEQPDPKAQPRLHWTISEDQEQEKTNKNVQLARLSAEGTNVQRSKNTLSRASRDEGQAGGSIRVKRSATRNVFMDVEMIKTQLKKDLTKHTYTTADFYWETGYARSIATNSIFESFTLFVILFNALWMGYDANSNDAASLTSAEIQFFIAENFFCAFFTIEWFIRFCAFKNKLNCFRDFWFMFDSGLLIFMIAETWILTAFASGSGAKVFQGLRWLRLVRLTRLARIARLLRAVPELLIMVKAIIISLKTVSYTFVLLLLVGYIFGVAFTILTEGKDLRFNGVLTSMNTLLLAGALPDQAGLVNELKDGSPEPANYGYYVLIILYLMIASLMMMNMLIGMLTEVISGVATLEKEQMTLTKVKENLQEMLTALHIISEEESEVTKQEFESLLTEPKAAIMLQDVGVDVVGLVDFADYIFSEERPVLTFEEFMDVVLQLRGSNTASVKDIVDLRKLVIKSHKTLQDSLGIKLPVDAVEENRE
eukprot:TRINITY_DN29438_c0_g1_i1.p1 TRINITY_DN29438_c0_g1~~TRINITY_DN29438_c0_g1_i1.p1  ORF type:complete len:642 (+),score=111.97 TRINITY_DN29438_c0_g1_i1:83-2008(+)